jgi:Icc-related predicted phosphoesterase
MAQTDAPLPRTPVRLAAVGDIHCTKAKRGELSPYFTPVNEQADVLLLCGDLTDYGLPDEAAVLVKELSVVRVPMLAVLGNHDHESGKEQEVTAILSEAGIRVLQGDGVELHDVGFAGAKGFFGGFDNHTLGFWGEAAAKRFVQEAIDESLRLEGALARLRTPRRVALMHYAPIRATVEGEPLEIFPFLGCSRLEEPLKRYPVDVVFHGHAHRGQLEGRTSGGTPVYNVAMPLLRRSAEGAPSYRVVTLS